MRKRKFSLWKPVSLDEFTTKSAQTSIDPSETFIGRIRKHSTAFLSPWASNWRTDPGSIDVISAPKTQRRSVYQNKTFGAHIGIHYAAELEAKDLLLYALLIGMPLLLLALLIWILFS